MFHCHAPAVQSCQAPAVQSCQAPYSPIPGQPLSLRSACPCPQAPPLMWAAPRWRLPTMPAWKTRRLAALAALSSTACAAARVSPQGSISPKVVIQSSTARLPVQHAASEALLRYQLRVGRAWRETHCSTCLACHSLHKPRVPGRSACYSSALSVLVPPHLPILLPASENMYNMRDTNLGRCSDDFYVSWGHQSYKRTHRTSAVQPMCTAGRALQRGWPLQRAGPAPSQCSAHPTPPTHPCAAAPQPCLLHHPHLYLRLQLIVLWRAFHPGLGEPGAGLSRDLQAASPAWA